MNPIKDLIVTLDELYRKWGVTPVVIAACANGRDMHLQIWHPEYTEMPCYVFTPDGKWREHPDAPWKDIEAKEKGPNVLAFHIRDK